MGSPAEVNGSRVSRVTREYGVREAVRGKEHLTVCEITTESREKKIVFGGILGI